MKAFLRIFCRTTFFWETDLLYKRLLITAAAGIFALSSAQAAPLNCWDMAGKKFNIDPWLLLAIADVETGLTSRSFNKNSNGSYDLGLMQVNTIHLKELSKYGINGKHLLDNDCVGIYVAAMLLKRSTDKYGMNIDGIGGYHSGTPSKRRAYGRKVLRSYANLVDKYYVRRQKFALRSK